MSAIQKAICELKSGTYSGYNYIYQKFKNLLFKLGVDSNLHYEEAEDLMNETFYKLPKIISKFEYKNDNAFRIWLITVHMNGIRGYFRNKKLDYSHLDDNQWEKIEEINNDQIEDKRIIILKEEIEKLPEKERILFNMRGKSIPYKTISEILNIRPGTLRVQYPRIINKLERTIKEKFRELKLL